MDDNSENQKENINIEDKIKLYLEQMTEDEKIVLEIAKELLKSSFSLKKSIGFIDFCQNNNL